MSDSPALATAFLHVGVIQISVANLIVIGLMVVVFVLALVLPFPHSREVRSEDHHDQD